MSKQCSCGNNRFSAYMTSTYEVMLGENGDWERDLSFIRQGEHHGPYICAACDKQYEEWWDIPDAPEEEESDE